MDWIAMTLLGAVCLLAFALAGYSIWHESGTLGKLAAELGLAFDKHGDPDIAAEIDALGLFPHQPGERPYRKMLYGAKGRVRFALFELSEWELRGTVKIRVVESMALYCQSTDLKLPRLAVVPTALTDRFRAQYAGACPPPDSPAEFGRMFQLLSDDQPAAQRVAAGVANLLVQHPQAVVVAAGDRVAIKFDGRRVPEGEWKAFLRQALGMCSTFIKASAA